VIYIPVYTVVQLPINQYFGKMIASLHDENNHITIPGFMTMSKNYLLRKELKWQKPFSLENIKKALDLKDVYGEKLCD
jgi:hypothetical protein